MNDESGKGCQFLVTVGEVARSLEDRGLGLRALAEEDPKWFYEKICKAVLGKVQEKARDDGCQGRVTVILEIPGEEGDGDGAEGGHER